MITSLATLDRFSQRKKKTCRSCRQYQNHTSRFKLQKKCQKKDKLKNSKKLISYFDEFDQYLLHKNRHQQKKIRKLTKQVQELSNKLIKFETKLQKSHHEHKQLKNSVFKLMTSRTRFSEQTNFYNKSDSYENLQLDYNKQLESAKQLNPEHCDNSSLSQYLPKNTMKNINSKHSSRYHTEYQNLYEQALQDYQLIAPNEYIKQANLDSLTKILDELIMSQIACKSLEERLKVRQKILNISQQIQKIVQKDKNNLKQLE